MRHSWKNVMENREQPPNPNIEAPPVLEPPPVIAADQSELPRTPIGWIAVLLLFGLLGLITVGSRAVAPTKLKGDPYGQQELEIRGFMSFKNFESTQKKNDALMDKEMKDQIDTGVVQYLERWANDDPRAGKLLVVVQQELGEQIAPGVLEKLSASRNSGDRAFAQIYQTQSLTVDQANSLSAQMPDDQWAFRAAKVQARALAGDPGPRIAFAPPWKYAGLRVVEVIAVLAAFAGIFVWIFYFNLRSKGALAPLGHPAEPLSYPEADRFAVRAAMLVIAFILAELGGELLHVPAAAQFFTSSLLLVIFFVLVHSLPAGGIAITLRRIGATTDNWKRDILWGLAGYLAAAPGILISFVVAAFLMKVFGQSSHPVSEVIAEKPNFWIVFATFFSAAMAAPFCEELLFRGTLLPALAKVFKSPAWGIVLSSFLFASLHPQGIPLWLGLGFIGAMNCMLAYQTRSLIPCMVLHAVHNGIIVFVSFFLT